MALTLHRVCLQKVRPPAGADAAAAGGARPAVPASRGPAAAAAAAARGAKRRGPHGGQCKYPAAPEWRGSRGGAMEVLSTSPPPGLFRGRRAPATTTSPFVAFCLPNVRD